MSARRGAREIPTTLVRSTRVSPLDLKRIMSTSRLPAALGHRKYIESLPVRASPVASTLSPRHGHQWFHNGRDSTTRGVAGRVLWPYRRGVLETVRVWLDVQRTGARRHINRPRRTPGRRRPGNALRNASKKQSCWEMNERVRPQSWVRCRATLTGSLSTTIVAGSLPKIFYGYTRRSRYVTVTGFSDA